MEEAAYNNIPSFTGKREKPETSEWLKNLFEERQEALEAGVREDVKDITKQIKEITLAKDPTIFVYIATAVVLLNVLAGRKGSRRRNQKLMINIVGFFSRYTYHSLLVVQGSISIAYWSSQPSVPQHTTTPPGPPLLRRCVFLLGLAAFGSVRSYIFDYTARRAIA